MDSNKGRGLATIEQVIGYWSVEERVEADFARARRRAMFGRVSARLRGDRDRLPKWALVEAWSATRKDYYQKGVNEARWMRT